MPRKKSNTVSAFTGQFESLYLIRKVRYVIDNKFIYKLGRTEQPIHERLKSYDKGFEFIIAEQVDDSKSAELRLKRRFLESFKQVNDIDGIESFKGNVREMKNIFREVCDEFSPFIAPAIDPDENKINELCKQFTSLLWKLGCTKEYYENINFQPEHNQSTEFNILSVRVKFKQSYLKLSEYKRKKFESCINLDSLDIPLAIRLLK